MPSVPVLHRLAKRDWVLAGLVVLTSVSGCKHGEHRFGWSSRTAAVEPSFDDAPAHEWDHDQHFPPPGPAEAPFIHPEGEGTGLYPQGHPHTSAPQGGVPGLNNPFEQAPQPVFREPQQSLPSRPMGPPASTPRDKAPATTPAPRSPSASSESSRAGRHLPPGTARSTTSPKSLKSLFASRKPQKPGSSATVAGPYSHYPTTVPSHPVTRTPAVTHWTRPDVSDPATAPISPSLNRSLAARNATSQNGGLPASAPIAAYTPVPAAVPHSASHGATSSYPNAGTTWTPVMSPVTGPGFQTAPVSESNPVAPTLTPQEPRTPNLPLWPHSAEYQQRDPFVSPGMTPRTQPAAQPASFPSQRAPLDLTPTSDTSALQSPQGLKKQTVSGVTAKTTAYPALGTPSAPPSSTAGLTSTTATGVAAPGVSISRLAICREVRRYEDYTEMDRHQLRAGQPLLLYSALDHCQHMAIADGYRTMTETQVQILTRSGQVLAKQSLGTAVDVARSPRRDYFLSHALTVPESLPGGDYVLQVTVHDLVGKQTAQSAIDFRLP